MDLLDRLAERHIEEAIARGELDDLPGQGKPLDIQDLSAVPESLRPAWILLKNSGYLPPEVELRREIADVNALLAAATAVDERTRLSRRLRLLQLRLGSSSSDVLSVEERYREAVQDRFDPDDRSGPTENQ